MKCRIRLETGKMLINAECAEKDKKFLFNNILESPRETLTFNVK